MFFRETSRSGPARTHPNPTIRQAQAGHPPSLISLNPVLVVSHALAARDDKFGRREPLRDEDREPAKGTCGKASVETKLGIDRAGKRRRTLGEADDRDVVSLRRGEEGERVHEELEQVRGEDPEVEDARPQQATPQQAVGRPLSLRQ